MGIFDDVLEKEKKRSFSSEGSAPPVGDPVNIVDLLEGPDSPLSGYLQGMNPEMKSKVLVPLASLLDKYGLGESLASSPTATGAVGLMGVIGDIAPVIKGLADFVSGQRNGLAEDDKRFLEEIMKAENSSEFSDLFTDMGEEVVEAPKPKRVHPLIGELPDIDTSQGSVDWMKVLDPDGSLSQKKESQAIGLDAYAELVQKKNPMASEPKIKMPSLEELAQQAGVTMETLKAEDSNIKPDDAPVLDIESESFTEDLMDSIVDSSAEDEIVYMTDEEYDEMVEQGYEFDEV